jgi:5-methylcytosine-specific restriction endonuclease McrA
MEGWKLQEGIYKREEISEDEIWQIFNYIFSTKSVNRTSYKYGFLKALLESAFSFNRDGEINLNEIFTRFTHIYWALIVDHKLKQGDSGVKGGKTSVELIFEDYVNQFEFIRVAEFDVIRDDVRNKIVKETLTECKKYVVGALYGDTDEMFYSFSLKKNYLKLNPSVFKFIKKFNRILIKLNDLEWMRFMEKVNPEEQCTRLLTKLDTAAERSNLNPYRDLLYKELNQKHCFYCGKKLDYSNIHVDHFIPWSFIRNDKSWNFVLSCSKCNTSKSDKIADEVYLNKLIERNDKIAGCENDIIKLEFEKYNTYLLNEVYNSAIYNGFNQGWAPKGLK